MKHTITWIIMALALGQQAFSTTSEKMFYRIVAETNTAIIGWTAAQDLTWTNSATNITYAIQATSDLGNGLTSFWGAVETGLATNLIMTSKVPKPETPFPPGNSTVLIPAGSYLMGNFYATDPLNDYEYPPRPIYTRPFYMDSTEITKGKWDEVVNWATNKGYVFGDTATGTDTNYPVTSVSWYDCVKWCNARSEKEGLTPAYFTNETWTAIYREGALDLSATNVNWNGNGYRLPTEAEWEKAARGGLYQNYFPWPSPGGEILGATNYLDETKANYSGSGTTNVSSFAPNAYGLYDMAGNVREWCWDFWGLYKDFSDPTGPTNGTERVTRGGAWSDSSTSLSLRLRCSARDASMTADRIYDYNENDSLGFRCVRSCP